jgi:GNAT superfamily N-acetyltransferase
MLSRAYWAIGRPRECLERALQNSLVFGLYDGMRMIGLARVVSDFAVFAYLCDVVVHEEYRCRGLGKWLIETVHQHPALQGVRRWTLATLDAHELYRGFGWGDLSNPERWMEIVRPFPGEEQA